MNCSKVRQFLKTIKQYRTPKRMSSVFKRSVNFFFHDNLLLTNSISSGICMATGDIIIQELEFRTGKILERYDWARAMRMFTVGASLGVFHHWYYLKLDKLIPKVNLTNVFIKIGVDQVFCGPLTYLGFFYGMGFLERKTLKETNDELKQKFLLVFLGDCIFWPPVQFVNFYFLKTEYRVLYINLATVVFDMYVAFVKFYLKGDKQDV